MQVISPRPPIDIDITCNGRGNGGKGCSALLKIDGRNDLRYFPGYEGVMVIEREAVTCKCPECGTLNDLSHSQWPHDFKNLKRFTQAWKEGIE